MIKQLLLAAVLVAPMAQASNNLDCAAISQTAQIIMEKRQQEVSRIALENIINSADDMGIYKEISLALVSDAYSQRAKAHPDNQKKAALRFANDAYTACQDSKK